MGELNNSQIEALAALVIRLAATPHGARGSVYADEALALGISVSTLHRRLKQYDLRRARKQRSDNGKTGLSLAEAHTLSTVLMESHRRNGKQLYSIDDAVRMLRANGALVAGGVEAATGEFKPLSTSAVSRGLRLHGLHPDQLRQAAPAVALASGHPNHCWQVDASLSTQYYLDAELTHMPAGEYYKNKPDNYRRIERQRLWRYVVTDHCSGAIYVEYVTGAESAENLCNVLINAMQQRGNQDPFCGVPFAIMTDPGAAMTSAPFRNLCKALGIELIINQAGNARAKGQVEQAHNLVERKFEAAMKFVAAVRSLEQINAKAWEWMRGFNATAIHTRTQRTRNEVWMRILPEQMRRAPPVEVCRSVATWAPVSAKVDQHLRVAFRGGVYDVSGIANANVGDKILVTRCPWSGEDQARAVLMGADGREHYHDLPKVQPDQWGFLGAVTIGSGYARHADTAADIHRKSIERLAMDASTDGEAAAARKAKKVPFGGALDPFKPSADLVVHAHLPRRGTDLDLTRHAREIPPLSPIEAALLLKQRLRERYPMNTVARLQERYPNGVPRDDIDAIAAWLAPALRIAGGQE